jgi:hypothetical protein
MSKPHPPQEHGATVPVQSSRSKAREHYERLLREATQEHTQGGQP